MLFVFVSVVKYACRRFPSQSVIRVLLTGGEYIFSRAAPARKLKILLLLNMAEGDFYKTIWEPSEGLYKDKGSKFIARVFHVENPEEVRENLLRIRKEFHDARHFCYAYRMDPENETFKSSDDGEPAGTAGKPILNQILSHELMNVLVVVVRYFGGTKLGVSGLIRAYKTAAEEALTASEIMEGVITRKIKISFDYPLTNEVMKVIHEEQIKIVEKNFSDLCNLTLEMERKQTEKIKNQFDKIFGVSIK